MARTFVNITDESKYSGPRTFTSCAGLSGRLTANSACRGKFQSTVCVVRRGRSLSRPFRGLKKNLNASRPFREPSRARPCVIFSWSE